MEKGKNFSLKDFMQMPDKNIYETADSFQQFIHQLDRNQQRQYGVPSQNGVGPHMQIRGHYSKELKDTVSFVGNDYLGLSRHPQTIQAGIRALYDYGTGACAAPMLGGYLQVHEDLEKELASFLDCDDAIIYSSGFGANMGTLQALLHKQDLALIDIFVHASVIDGLQQTNVKMFKHNDCDYLDFLLRYNKSNYKTIFVIVDGVYSQDGDLAPLPEILEICKKHGAFLMVDDAHGIGVFGKQGMGVVEHFQLQGQVDIISGTFSKSMGCVGGFVAASERMIQYLKYYSRTSTYSAAISPQTTASALAALRLIQCEPERRKRLWENVHYLKHSLQQEGFDTGQSVSPIVPIMIRDDQKVQEAARLLLENNIFVVPIIYPGVKSKESRLRVSLSALHEKQDLDRLLEALFLADKQIGLKKNVTTIPF